jgi:uncharacterized protein
MMLLDSNVLIYALNRDEPLHRSCREVVERAMRGRLDCAVFPQILMEFFATITSPARARAPVAPAEAVQRIADWRETLTLRHPTAQCLVEFATLVEATPRVGQAVHDLFIAAQMRAHGIGEICTANARDFEGIPGITVRSPESV